MKLYVHPMSSNARRASMAAIALGQKPELIRVDLQKGEQKQPDYLALNPNGKVPTLVDGDVVIWESLAIMTYLADKTPGQTLYPTELVARTQVQKWLFWAAAHWGPAVATLNFENFLKRMFGQGEPDAYSVKRFGAMFGDLATVLDATLAKSRHVAGDKLTLVDYALAAPLMYAKLANLPIDGHPNVVRWFGEMQLTEAWKATEPPPMRP
jgi:glutathione S-transferase